MRRARREGQADDHRRQTPGGQGVGAAPAPAWRLLDNGTGTQLHERTSWTLDTEHKTQGKTDNLKGQQERPLPKKT